MAFLFAAAVFSLRHPPCKGEVSVPVIGITAALCYLAVSRGCVYHFAVADINTGMVYLGKIIAVEEQDIAWLQVGLIFYFLPTADCGILLAALLCYLNAFIEEHIVYQSCTIKGFGAVCAYFVLLIYQPLSSAYYSIGKRN